jgi:glycine dehydrogenase subunit 2
MDYSTLIFERSKSGRIGYSLPRNEYEGGPALAELINPSLLRDTPAKLPEVSELDVVRHYTLLSQKNFAIETGFYPLGSCTMKYNPKINEVTAGMKGFNQLHPFQSPESLQGMLQVYYETERMLSEILGLSAFSLNSFAGAQGELVGLMVMKQYHLNRKDYKRTKIIVPDSAHGTNPASAAVAGFDIIEIKSTSCGLVDIDALKAALSDEVAGIMLTNPNTLGLFEKDILEVSRLVHEAGGLLYYDGANLNALLGVTRPGDMGFDVVHVNLHKTFSTPHGGGGPGSGPVGVAEGLVHLLPNPRIVKDGTTYRIEESQDAIGRIGGFFGNAMIVVRAYTYLRTLGKENLACVGKLAVLNANYIKERLRDLYVLPIDTVCKHEFVFNGLIDQSTGVKTLDIAKRLLDFGVHAPTIYFPLLFNQSIMIEPTEVESKETLDQFIELMRTIAKEAVETPDVVKTAPHITPVRRLDEVTAARKPILTFKDLNPNG